MLQSARLERWSLTVAALLFAAACEDARTPAQPGAAQFDEATTGHPATGDRPQGQTECNPRSRGQSGVSCVAFTSVTAPMGLTIDGLEGRVAVSASNEGPAGMVHGPGPHENRALLPAQRRAEPWRIHASTSRP